MDLACVTPIGRLQPVAIEPRENSENQENDKTAQPAKASEHFSLEIGEVQL
jgi:hypothetical protein